MIIIINFIIENDLYNILKIGNIEVLFDKEDIHKINQHKWYIYRNKVVYCENSKLISLSRYLLLDLLRDGEKVFFINKNKYDCRKSNLTIRAKSIVVSYEDDYAFFIINNKYKVLIDIEDIDFICEHCWHVIKNGYVCRKTNDGKSIYLHRVLTRCEIGEECDHINLNKLDNRKNNLRLCNRAQNQRNQNPRKDKLTSKYRGVDWYKKGNCWRVRVRIHGKEMFLGYFTNEKAAANAYNLYAKIYFKDFARSNNVEYMDINLFNSFCIYKKIS